MTTWHEYVQKGEPVPEWPYPINYGKVNEVTSDVLVIGGGVAGCRAAISAVKNGAKTVLAERGHAKRSGSGGAGVDHWHGAVTNPCSKVTPEDYTQAIVENAQGYTSGHARYIVAREGWDTFLELEPMGVRIRDVNDEFAGAPFRDEKTKLMFAYNYENRHILRIWGHNLKPCVYNEMKRVGVEVYNRIVITSLLTEGGKQGGRVVGATGVNTRTGEFYVFKAKATIIAASGVGRLFGFAPELSGPSSMSDLNAAGVAQAICWKAGAELVMAEQSFPFGGGSSSGYAPYSMGNPSNTWHGASMVDANGKEIPWVDGFGRELKTVAERFLPFPGQKFEMGLGIGVMPFLPQYMGADIIHDLPQRIIKGEFKLPLYADLTTLPELERRAIFGLMVGNEGKTRIPIYDTYTRAGFDPDKDMLQAPVMHPQGYGFSTYWFGVGSPYAWGASGGSLLVDWDLKTSLEGLYAAGISIFSAGMHGESHTTGRYAGRKAAAYARNAPEPAVDPEQVAAEKARAYEPLKQSKEGNGWKELNYAISKVMGDYCGQYKHDLILNAGLRLLKELRETEAAQASASNPHELGRLLECFSLISVGELVFHACLARKTNNMNLGFMRVDSPPPDPSGAKHLPIRLENDKVKVRELPLDYYLKVPYASTYKENYERHCGL